MRVNLLSPPQPNALMGADYPAPLPQGRRKPGPKEIQGWLNRKQVTGDGQNDRVHRQNVNDEPVERQAWAQCPAEGQNQP